MTTFALVLMVFAFVLFALAAFWRPSEPPRVNLIAAGLAFWTAAVIFAGASVAGYLGHG